MVRPWANEWIHGVPSARRMILGDAAPVLDTLQRVGQRLAFEALRVRQHVADGAAGQRRVVERQLDIRPQYALALPDDDLPGGFLRHAGARDQLLGLRLDECRLAPSPSQAPVARVLWP